MDLPCSRCGYNLRGLSARGRCPECAASVASTRAMARALHELDPRTLRRMCAGAVLLLAVSLFAFAPRDWAYDEGTGSIRFVLPRLIACAGVALLATPSRKVFSRNRRLRFDLVARALAGASAGAILLSFTHMNLNGWLELGLPLLAGVAMYLHLWRVLARLGNVRLAGQCLAIAAVLPVAHVLPFFAPFMQGPGSLAIAFFIMTIPAIGPPHMSQDVLVELVRHPSAVLAALGEADALHVILAYMVPPWATCLLLVLSFRLGMAIKRSRKGERGRV